MFESFHHPKHTVYTLSIDDDFLLCLSYVELGGVKHTTRDIFELKLFVVFFLGLDKEVANLHECLRKPYHYQYVDDVEDGVKHRKTEGNSGCVAHSVYGVAGTYILRDNAHQRH